MLCLIGIIEYNIYVKHQRKCTGGQLWFIPDNCYGAKSIFKSRIMLVSSLECKGSSPLHYDIDIRKVIRRTLYQNAVLKSKSGYVSLSPRYSVGVTTLCHVVPRYASLPPRCSVAVATLCHVVPRYASLPRSSIAYVS